MPEEFNPEPILKAMRHSSIPATERMARPRDMTGHEDEESEADLQALRDENDSLRAENQELKYVREVNKQLNDFINEATGLLPPSYDMDEAPEAIIIRFLKDTSDLGRIIAKLTSDYRLS